MPPCHWSCVRRALIALPWVGSGLGAGAKTGGAFAPPRRYPAGRPLANAGAQAFDGLAQRWWRGTPGGRPSQPPVRNQTRQGPDALRREFQRSRNAHRHVNELAVKRSTAPYDQGSTRRHGVGPQAASPSRQRRPNASCELAGQAPRSGLRGGLGRAGALREQTPKPSPRKVSGSRSRVAIGSHSRR